MRGILTDPLATRMISIKMIQTFCDINACLRQSLERNVTLNCDVFLVTGAANKVTNVESAIELLKRIKCRDKKSTFFEHGEITRETRPAARRGGPPGPDRNHRLDQGTGGFVRAIWWGH